MPSQELQHTVDALAARLGRSVSVDDPSMRLLSASRHFGDEDPARVRSVLDRYAGDSEADFVRAQGIDGWTTPGRVPAHPPELSPRWCVPIRSHGLLLGYLWLIDPAEEVTSRQLDVVVEAVDAIGLVLYRQLVLHEREQARASALLRDLTSPDPASRTRAVQEIRDDGLLPTQVPTVVLTAELFVDARREPDASTAALLATALEVAVRSVLPHPLLSFAHGSRATVLAGSSAPPVEKLISAVADALVRECASTTGPGTRLAIGVGGVRPNLELAAESHRQAVIATRAARLLPGLRPVARWDRLGPYSLLLELPPERVAAEEWLPGLARLQAADDGGNLLGSLETFLDNAGDVQRTARSLGIHRTTLYHRLQRIEQVTALDLRTGTDRLSLHLGVKLARLADAWRAQPDA